MVEPGKQGRASKSKGRALDDNFKRGLSGRRAVYLALSRILEDYCWNKPHLAKILNLHVNTVRDWFSKEEVPVSVQLTPNDQAVIHLIAIHRNLYTMFSRSENALKWLTSQHPELKLIPVEKMKSGVEGLVLIRQYLDYQRGRGA